MKIFVTGGAGFIGRWLVKKLLEMKYDVISVDDLSNGRRDNIIEFNKNPNFKFIKGDIRSVELITSIFKHDIDIVFHLAAEINVQNSLNKPTDTFERDIVGTFNLLEQSRQNRVKFVFMSSCMVYERSHNEDGITELHPVKPASPYAASKLSGEHLTLAYYHSYQLPTVVLRPFNIYGPYQKTSGEGGVLAIFIKRALNNQILNIYGDGTQTRDFLYVEDCVDFILKAGSSDKALGEIINAGVGKDISISQLAKLIVKNPQKIKYLPHIHSQSEIMKLKCNLSKAERLLGWKPKYSLKEGLKITEKWIKDNPNL